jgi:LysR family hydrogen peroxide-inducible transcriptional activator
LDMLIVSTPFNAKGIITELLYKEPLVVALPRGHSLCRKKTIKADDLLSETLLLLKTGNCFRDQVMDVCPACKGEVFSKAKIQQTLEGSSLETIRQMVATGSGVTILPGSSIFDPIEKNSLVEYRPFSRPVPKREVILAYRDTYPGKKLISLISETISNCGLNDL